LFSPLNLRTIDEKPGYFLVTEDVMWHHDDLPGGVYLVPRGFETDLASIPVGLRNLFSRTGRSRKPAVFHDHMYSRRFETRKICDEYFRLALIERGVPAWKARIYWLGVRLGGAIAAGGNW